MVHSPLGYVPKRGKFPKTIPFELYETNSLPLTHIILSDFSFSALAQTDKKLRVLVLSDIEAETRPLWTNAMDSVYSTSEKKGSGTIQATIWRWRGEFQHDFAA